jgi:uroporphyrinogen-III synthase
VGPRGPAGGDTGGDVGVLAGYAVAVATDRRRHRMAADLEALGAKTVSVQAVRTVSQGDEETVRAATALAVSEPIHEVVVSSAVGLRAWLAAATRAGAAAALLVRLADARLLARDARTADALRELGLTQIWSTAAGTTEDLFRYLIAQPMAGRRVVAQLDSEPARELCHLLHDAGAQVIEVPVYRSEPPNHVDVLRRLADQIVKRQVDAVALTSRSAAGFLLDQAHRDGRRDQLLNACVADVLLVAMGALTAQPIAAFGVPVTVAPSAYPAALVARLAESMPQRALHLRVAGQAAQVRGQGLLLGGRLIPLQAGPIAVLRALARQPGRVFSVAEIRAEVPGWAAVDDHAIEAAVSRLRRSVDAVDLDGNALVQTVVRRGYRLPV